MYQSAHSEAILGIIAVIVMAILAAAYIFPALGNATQQDTSWGGILMIIFAVVLVAAVIIGLITSRKK